MSVKKEDDFKSRKHQQKTLPSYTQGRSKRFWVVKNNKKRVTIALLFTVVDMEKQKVIIMPEAKPVITTIGYADLVRLQNTPSSLTRPCCKKRRFSGYLFIFRHTNLNMEHKPKDFSCEHWHIHLPLWDHHFTVLKGGLILE